MKEESKKNQTIVDGVVNWRNRGFKGLLKLESGKIDTYRKVITLFTQVRPKATATINPAVIMEIDRFDFNTCHRFGDTKVYVFTVEEAFKDLHFKVVEKMREAKKVWVY